MSVRQPRTDVLLSAPACCAHRPCSARTETASPEESPHEPPIGEARPPDPRHADDRGDLHPCRFQAAPIDDLQAQANQLEQQINQNAEKLSTLNEQINTAQGKLDQAVADIQHANDLVAAAQAKTRELRAEVARCAPPRSTRRAAARGASRTSTPRRAGPLHQVEVQLSRRAARRPDHQRSREGEGAGHDPQGPGRGQRRKVAQEQRDAIQVQKNELDAGQAKLEALQGQVKGEIADLVAKAEAERQAGRPRRPPPATSSRRPFPATRVPGPRRRR